MNNAVIESERLCLYEFTVEDAAFIVNLLNSPQWIRFIGDRNVRTPDEARNYIMNRLMSSYREFGFGFYLVKLKSSLAPIGMCGIVKREVLEEADLGFALLPSHFGLGYAFEAASATLLFAKDHLSLKRIQAIAAPDNTNSIKLLKKLGLKYKKRIRLPEDEESLMLFEKKL